MTKKDMIESIELARETHQAQMDIVRSIVKGEDVEEPVALGKMECPCGMWFYGNKDMMVKILGHQLFERLDALHEKWHVDYSRIHAIYVEHQKKKEKMIGKLFFQNLSHKQKEKLTLYYRELKEDTKELLNVAETALRRVSALQESKFEAL